MVRPRGRARRASSSSAARARRSAAGEAGRAPSATSTFSARGQRRDQVELLEDEPERSQPQLGQSSPSPSPARSRPSKRDACRRSAGRARRAAAAGSTCPSRSAPAMTTNSPSPIVEVEPSSARTAAVRRCRSVFDTPVKLVVAVRGAAGVVASVRRCVIVVAPCRLRAGRRSLDAPQGLGRAQARGADAADGAGDEAAQRRRARSRAASRTRRRRGRSSFTELVPAVTWPWPNGAAARRPPRRRGGPRRRLQR